MVAHVDDRLGQFNVVVQPLSGGRARTLTSFEDSAVRRVTWHPDGRSVLFEADSSGDEFTRLCLVGIEGGQPQVLVADPKVRLGAEQVEVALSRPGQAQTSLPVSWVTTAVRYRWPRLYETSSMPIRRSPASRSTLASASAATLPMIAPTVRHPMRISCPTAVLEVCTASHATWSSKAKVCPA
jgi:hypothetical protein